jgi:hypothetical protein
MARIRRANSRKNLAEGKPSLGMGNNFVDGVRVSMGIPSEKGHCYIDMSIEEFDKLAAFVAETRSTYHA